MKISLYTKLWIIGFILCAIFSGCTKMVVQDRKALDIVTNEIPMELRSVFNEANEALNQGNDEKALQLCGIILNKVKKGKLAAWAFLRRGEIFSAQAKYEDAVKAFSQIQKTEESESFYREAAYRLALVYAQTGNYADSSNIIKTLLLDAVSLNRRAELETLEAMNCLDQGLVRDAFRWNMQALRRNPDDSIEEIIKERIEYIIAYRMNKDDLEVMRKEVASGFPEGFILFALGKMYYDQGDFQLAEKILKDYLHQYQNHSYYLDGEKLYQSIIETKMVDRYAIGCVLPLTGKYAAYGNRALDAIMLATGVFDPEKSSPIKLFIEDSCSNPAMARAAVKKLSNDYNVIGIIGPLGSPTAAEAAEEAQQWQVPIVTLTPRSNITDIGTYVFRSFLTGEMQISTLVEYAMTNLGATTFAILYPKDSYGKGMMQLFGREVSVRGGDIYRVEGYDIKQTDFGKEIKALTNFDFQEKDIDTENKQINPIVDFDALFIPDSYSRVLMIAPQLAFYDVKNIQLLGTNGWNSPDLLKTDNQYLEGAVFVDDFFKNSFVPHVGAFIDLFYVAFGREPGNIEAVSYDAASILKTILQQSNVRTRYSLRQTLASLSDYVGVAGTLSFSETREAKKSIAILMVQNGEIIQLR